MIPLIFWNPYHPDVQWESAELLQSPVVPSGNCDHMALPVRIQHRLYGHFYMKQHHHPHPEAVHHHWQSNKPSRHPAGKRSGQDANRPGPFLCQSHGCRADAPLFRAEQSVRCRWPQKNRACTNNPAIHRFFGWKEKTLLLCHLPTYRFVKDGMAQDCAVNFCADKVRLGENSGLRGLSRNDAGTKKDKHYVRQFRVDETLILPPAPSPEHV